MFCMCSSLRHTLYMWCLFFYCYLMAASKELCSICAKPIYGKQDACDLLHFHCTCSQISDTERVLFTSSGKSSFQCEAYTKPLCQHKMMTCHLGLSTYYLHLMLQSSPEKELHFPEFTARFCGVITMGMMENLVSLVST